jgi:hypothetical protein
MNRGRFFKLLGKDSALKGSPLKGQLGVIGFEGPAWGGGEGLPEASVPGSELSLDPPRAESVF